MDAEHDREHPVKRERPVAAGRVTKRQAYLIAVVSILVGLLLSASLGRAFFFSVIGYLLLQVLYGAAFRRIAIVDMLAIALGFVIRAVAGAFVINVVVSPWLVLCTGLLALFLAASKRRHELVLLQERSADHRPVLSDYSAELLDSFMVTLSSATITSYALYTFFSQTGTEHPYLMATLPFVIYGIFRYILLVHNGKGTGSPELLIISDRPLLADIILWAAACAVIVAMPGRF
jgi:4-hydroxybenzoate polyprenyltransferase